MNFESVIERGVLKPAGVKILTWLFAIGGVVYIVLGALAVIHRDDTTSMIDDVGPAAFLAMLGIQFQAILTIGSAIGLFMGQRWGWWLATYYFAYSIVRDVGAAVMTLTLLEAPILEAGAREPGFYAAKYGVRVCISLLAYLYLLSPRVRVYFGALLPPSVRVILLEYGISVGLWVGVLVVNRIGSG